MKKTTRKLLYVLIISLLFFSSVRASEINNYPNEYDSMYRYNALENKISFVNLINVNKGDIPKEKMSIVTSGQDSTAKNLPGTTIKQESQKAETKSVTDSFKNVFEWFIFSL